MEQLRKSLHEAPIIDKDGYQYLVHPISNGVPMLEPALLREVVIGVARAADLDVDKIVAPEAMGIHIATALSLQTDIPLVVIRKRSYGLEDEVALHQTTGYSESVTTCCRRAERWRRSATLSTISARRSLTS
jgi:adenine phosphoribosyltransferase